MNLKLEKHEISRILRLLNRYIKSEQAHRDNRAKRGQAFVPEKGRRDISLFTLENLSRIKEKIKQQHPDIRDEPMIHLDGEYYFVVGPKRDTSHSTDPSDIHRCQELGIKWEIPAEKDGRVYTITKMVDGKLLAIEVTPLSDDLRRSI
jgi:hypothetical protein